MSEKILSAIIKSNKLGAAGLQVVGYAETPTATSWNELYLIYQIPEIANVDKIKWFEK